MPLRMNQTTKPCPPSPTRRSLLGAAAALPVVALPLPVRAQGSSPISRRLVIAAGKARLRPAPAAETEIWTLDGSMPGPALRIRQGETLRLTVENRTGLPVALHWHGLRGAAAMDGVGGFSQAPIAPGASFDYELTPPDSGTVLYRALVVGGASEPAGRGLSGLLIVEERAPLAVAQDIPLLVQDWLLDERQLLAPFGRGPETAAAGRLGSWLTVNGAAPPHRVAVAPGARVRLRLANACNARLMRLRFDGVKAVVVAVDGQPTDTFEPVRAQLPFAPGSRYDLVVDMPSEPGATAVVTALIGSGLPLVRLVAEGPAQPVATAPAALQPNPALPAAVRLQDARRVEMRIEGGARITPAFKLDLAGVDPERPWRVNGDTGSVEGKPLFSVRRGTPIVLAIDNRTAFIQPFHVHGHAFRLLHPLDDGWEPYFLDTVQIPEGKKLHIAFIADNPGRWLVSSTVLDRFDAGLWSWFEVT